MESRLLWETPVGTTVTTIHVQGRVSAIHKHTVRIYFAA